MSASDERPAGSAQSQTTVRLDTEAAVEWCLIQRDPETGLWCSVQGRCILYTAYREPVRHNSVQSPRTICHKI